MLKIRPGFPNMFVLQKSSVYGWGPKSCFRCLWVNSSCIREWFPPKNFTFFEKVKHLTHLTQKATFEKFHIKKTIFMRQNYGRMLYKITKIYIYIQNYIVTESNIMVTRLLSFFIMQFFSQGNWGLKSLKMFFRHLRND